MAKELAPIHEKLVKAGYKRPSVKVFTEAGPQYTEESYSEYFEKYEADLLKDMEEGGDVFFDESMPSGEVEVTEAEVAPTELPPPPATPKTRRPSFAYPGYYEPE